MRTQHAATGTIASLLCLIPLANVTPARAAETVATIATISTDGVRQVTYREEFNISGQVVDGQGRPVAQGTAAVQIKTADNPTWTSIFTGEFADGVVVYGYFARSNATYRIAYLGYTSGSTTDQSYAPSASEPITVKVSRDITTRTPDGRVVGTVLPSYANRTVQILRRVGQRYLPFMRVRTDEKGKFRAKLLGVGDTQRRFRLSVPGNSRFATGTEDLTVRR